MANVDIQLPIPFTNVNPSSLSVSDALLQSLVIKTIYQKIMEKYSIDARVE